MSAPRAIDTAWIAHCADLVARFATTRSEDPREMECDAFVLDAAAATLEGLVEPCWDALDVDAVLALTGADDSSALAMLVVEVLGAFYAWLVEEGVLSARMAEPVAHALSRQIEAHARAVVRRCVIGPSSGKHTKSVNGDVAASNLPETARRANYAA